MGLCRDGWILHPEHEVQLGGKAWGYEQIVSCTMFCVKEACKLFVGGALCHGCVTDTTAVVMLVVYGAALFLRGLLVSPRRVLYSQPVTISEPVPMKSGFKMLFVSGPASV